MTIPATISSRHLRSQGRTTTACETFWNTEELCDEILLHLDLNELLRIQEVCCSWKTSTQIRQATFITPTHHRVQPGGRQSRHGKAPRIITANGLNGETEDSKNIINLAAKPIINPFINNFLYTWAPVLEQENPTTLHAANHGLVQSHTPENIWKLPQPPSVFHQDSSSNWNMQFMQPAAKKMVLSCTGYLFDEDDDCGAFLLEEDENGDTIYDENGHSKMIPCEHHSRDERYIVESQTGVTIGQFISLLREHGKVCRQCVHFADEFYDQEPWEERIPLDRWIYTGCSALRILKTAWTRMEAGLERLYEEDEEDELDEDELARQPVPPGCGVTGHQVLAEIASCLPKDVGNRLDEITSRVEDDSSEQVCSSDGEGSEDSFEDGSGSE